MKIDISTLMFIFFVLFLIASIWKIWAFLPNKQLADDDTTQEAQAALLTCMLCVIQENKGNLQEKELFEAMKKDHNFDSKKFWRFNLNKLKHLLQTYYENNPQTSSIMDIYKK